MRLRRSPKRRIVLYRTTARLTHRPRPPPPHSKQTWEKVDIPRHYRFCRRRSSVCRNALVHGSLARAGKVKSQTPKVEKQEKKKTPKGRAKKRILYNRRCVVCVMELPSVC